MNYKRNTKGAFPIFLFFLLIIYLVHSCLKNNKEELLKEKGVIGIARIKEYHKPGVRALGYCVICFNIDGVNYTFDCLEGGLEFNTDDRNKILLIKFLPDDPEVFLPIKILEKEENRTYFSIPCEI